MSHREKCFLGQPHVIFMLKFYRCRRFPPIIRWLISLVLIKIQKSFHPKSFADDFTKSCLRIGCVMNATRASTASSSNNSLFGQFLTSFLFPDRKQPSNIVIGIQQFQPKCRWVSHRLDVGFAWNFDVAKLENHSSLSLSLDLFSFHINISHDCRLLSERKNGFSLGFASLWVSSSTADSNLIYIRLSIGN